MKDDVIEAIVAKMREVPRDGGFVDLADLARAILPIARKHFMEEAAGIAKTGWVSADYDVVGIADADVAMRLCEHIETAIRAAGEPASDRLHHLTHGDTTAQLSRSAP